MYNLNWYGKENAIKESFLPSNFKLIEDKESSKNWDETENLYIEGDNLEVLKLLQKSYFGKIKMIYIDPPYNTGNDFVYKDNFRDSIANYKEMTNQSTKANAETSGRYHTNWLNMMYPRLKLARNLLREDGVIFISIDDNEVYNLRKICDEIFGDTNYIGEFVKQSKVGGGSDSKYIAKEHEYLIMYSKNTEKSPEMFDEHDEKYLKRYKESDERGRYFWDTFARPGLKNPINYDIIAPDGTVINGDWIRSKARFEEEHKLGIVRVIKKDNGEWSVQFKQYLNNSGKKPRSMTTDFGGTIQGKKEIEELFNNDKIFSYPKSSQYIMKLIKFIGLNKDDIILDFFSGSCTTAHAVMQLNAEDNGNRKFIMVQLPEVTDEKSEAYKAGYKNICEIGKERIRRAGDKIVSESGKTDLDIGFKVFKLKEVVDMFYKTLNNDAIKIEVIKKTKVKGSIKIKIDGEIYYLVENENEYIVFNYSKGKKEVIASIFNKKDCKDTDYMELERLYTDKLVEFNQGWYHSNYVTTRILDEIYKQINN